ncbi:E1-E2 ATPase-domain-containing protein [Infundibulicybe gibba]|nr:E1-E2 ATPase-domain-containing protein [Infundibulicybe gibba]
MAMFSTSPVSPTPSGAHHHSVSEPDAHIHHPVCCTTQNISHLEKTSHCTNDNAKCSGGHKETNSPPPEANGCCSGNDGAKCCGEQEETDDKHSVHAGCCDDGSSCGGENVSRKQHENLDDESACMCCINILINEPSLHLIGGQDSDSHSNSDSVIPRTSSYAIDDADPAIRYMDAYTNRLRACCQALVKYCLGRSCCFVSDTTDKHIPPSAVPLSADSTDDSHSHDDKHAALPSPTATGEKLQLEIRGMDCVDCMPKVGRALAQLPSVTSTHTDYLSGIADLRYDPETISPAAISTYRQALLAPSSGSEGGIVTLPISFSKLPPPEAFDGYDTRPGFNSRIVEVSFPLHPNSSRRPRDVLDEFSKFAARMAACAVLTIPVLVFAWADLPPRPVLYGGICVGLTTLVQALAFPIFSTAIRAIVYLRQADMSVLVSVSTLVAYLFSVISYAFQTAGRPFAEPFFETSTLLVTLILLGRTVSAATRRSTGSALRELQRLQPPNVLLLTPGEKAPLARSLDSRLLYYGDIIRIPPETRFATDGLVVSGSSDADESSLTGESVAVPKEPGSRVIAGTLNLGGTLDIQVTRLVHENSLAHITALVKQAGSSRSPTQDLSDKLSAIILFAACASACIAFLVWALVGRYALRHPATPRLCPCAIGLALPTVMSVAFSIGLREGVLFRSAEALQLACDIDVVAFDKTGTLTQGNFTMERSEILVKGAEQIIHALVKDNIHPISEGVYRYLSGSLPSTAEHRGGVVTDIVSLPGKGIKASVCGFPLLGGSPSFTGACSHPLTSELQASGLSIFSVTLAGQPIAFFGLADTPRPGADALVAELTRRGKEVMILSGDTPNAVQHLADAINVPQKNVYASHTPEEKDAAITAWQAKGKRVCFIGDGTNDGPALSRADVALAMAAGSDVALTAAGGVLLGSDLRRGVLAFLDIANSAMTHARLALAWCVVYNIFAILLASGALVKVRIEPRWAGIGEVVSIVPVVAVALNALDSLLCETPMP